MGSLPYFIGYRPKTLVAGQDAHFTIGLKRQVEEPLEPLAEGEIQVDEAIDGVQLEVSLIHSQNGSQLPLGKKLVAFSESFGAETTIWCRPPEQGELNLTLRLCRIGKISEPARVLVPPVALGSLSVLATGQPGENLLASVDAQRAGLSRETMSLTITSSDSFSIETPWLGTPKLAVIPVSVEDFGNKLYAARDALNEVSEHYDVSAPDKAAEPLALSPEEGMKRTHEIATIGRSLYDQVLRSGFSVREKSDRTWLLNQLQSEDYEGIRISVQNTNGQFALPWNIIYDGELPGADDFEPKHVKGFWGYRYRFAEALPELPGQWRENTRQERKICAYVDPTLGQKGYRSSSLTDAAKLHRGFLEGFKARHRQASIDLLPDPPDAITSEGFDLLESLYGSISGGGGDDSKHLVYFFCHGESSSMYKDGKMVAKPAKLLLTSADHHHLTLDRLGAFDKEFGLDYKPEPVVFLNCCESASLDPFGGKGSLIAGFSSVLRAAAVVGSAWRVPGWFAHGFAQRFLEEFLKDRGRPLGEVLFDIRRELLEQLNPFGLIYHVFGNPAVRLT